MDYMTCIAIVLPMAGVWLISQVVRFLRRRAKTTPLRGPPSKSLIFGASRFLQESEDAALVYEHWAEEYGVVFRVPIAMAGSALVLCDPKAIQHFYSKETFGYEQTPMAKIFIENFIGRGLLWVEGEDHKRQRKGLAAAFSNAAIRKLAPIFFDSAYKIKDAWDVLLESSTDGEDIINIQDWMNRFSLDSVGIAGFSHDFGTLHGKHSAIVDVFDSFGKLKPTFFQIMIFVMGTVFPILARMPSARKRVIQKFRLAADGISRELIDRSRKSAIGEKGDHSVIGLLIKAANESTELHISEDEVMAQMKGFIFAGYETTSISLTWAFIELSKHQSYQAKLREELTSHFSSAGDTTYEHLTSDLPYLDAVVHEVLRLHPPLYETTRISTEDDIIPLSVPLQTADNKITDRISIGPGQLVTIPIRTINRSTKIWGADAKEFKPQRWLEEGGIQGMTMEIQGYRHLLTFVDGPSTCMGKNFALAEIKATLSVLIRNYSFELRDGVDMKFEMAKGIFPRPKAPGENGCYIPLRVRRID